MANVGKNIRLLRKQKNMTQDTLAELLYVSRQTVSNYETGRSNPDIDMLVKIAEVLETDVNVLIFGIPVSGSRKKEYIRLVCAVLLLFMSGIAYVYLRKAAEYWQYDLFNPWPAFSMSLMFPPVVCLICGFVIMQVLSLVWGIKRQSHRWIAVLHDLTMAALALYLILLLPLFLEWLSAGCQYVAGVTIPFDLADQLPRFWNFALARLWLWKSAAPFVFLPMGMVLWNGK